MAVSTSKSVGRAEERRLSTPIWGDALVRYSTHRDDFHAMSEGLSRLAAALAASGAEEVHSHTAVRRSDRRRSAMVCVGC